MSATLAAEYLTEVVAAAILIMAMVTWVRDRTASSRDVFLFFLTLAGSSTLRLVEYVLPVPDSISQIGSALLVAHPFFAMRVLYSMRAVPRLALWPAFAGALASVIWIVSFQDQEQEPGVPVILVVLYIAITDVYAGYAMLRGALRRSGISALRLRLGSLGLALVGLVMAQVGVAVAVPDIEGVTDVTIQMTALFTVLALFLGFSTPHWLARIALRSAAARFAHQRATEVVEQRDVDSIIATLVRWSADSTGGNRACLARWDPDSGRLYPKDGDIHWLRGHSLGPEDRWAWDAWRDRGARLVGLRELYVGLKEVLDREDVTNLYVVPIVAESGVGGLLIVPLNGRPLFPEAELRLLEMLGQLTIMEIGYAFLRQQQESLIQELSAVNEQLLESNKELESFSYTVSHDLRAPLRAINGFVSMVIAEEQSLSTESIRRLDVVRDNASKLGQLIDGLLAFSRLGRRSVQHETVDLRPLIEQIVDELMTATRPDGLTINISPAIPRCSGDPLLLKQMFTNLLTNAIKFTSSRKHGRIDIDLVSSQNPDQVTVRVKDNGIGFDMRYADKIFGVFERVHQSHDYEGAGIGLALVQRIVSRHGGMVWASGVPDQGASFYVALPAVPESETPIEESEDDTPDAREAEQPLMTVTKDQGESL